MLYTAQLRWLGNRGDGTAAYESYGREYRVRINGKADLLGSADPAFRGDPGLHNPEELLLIALASCHMLAYLALCARAGVRVLEYADDSSGTLALDGKGGGQMAEVVLCPRATVAQEADRTRAAALHDEAHARCFIASSCNFPVRHEPTVRVAGDGADESR